jgi:hypothetical protein
VLLLAQAERRMGIAAALSTCIADRRDQSRIIHDVDDILRARMLAIACGYEDADDLDALRHDPVLDQPGVSGVMPSDHAGVMALLTSVHEK